MLSRASASRLPEYPWLPHAIRVHGRVREDPLFWLRGASEKESAEKSPDLRRDSVTCPKSQAFIKDILQQELAHVDAHLPWRVRDGDSVMVQDGVSTESLSVASLAVAPISRGISPLVTMTPTFPDVPIVSDRAVRRKTNTRKKAQSRSLETPVHFLYRELRARVQEEDSSVPSLEPVSGFWHYSRIAPKKEYPIICRRPLTEASKGLLLEYAAAFAANPTADPIPHCDDEVVIMDLNQIVKEHNLESLDLGSVCESPAHNRTCAALDLSNGKEVFTLVVLHTPTQPPHAVAVERVISLLECSGDACFVTEDIIACVVIDSHQRGFQLVLHDLRLDPEADDNDVVIFEESDPRFTVCGLYVSDEDLAQRYFFFGSSSKDAEELHRVPLVGGMSIADIQRQAVCFMARPPDGTLLEATASVVPAILPGRDGWLLHHNYQCDNFTISTILEDELRSVPSSEAAGLPIQVGTPLLESLDKTVVEGVEVTASYVLISVRRDGFLNCFLFPMEAVQRVVLAQRSGRADARLGLAEGVNLREWFFQHISGRPGSHDLISLDASVAHDNSFYRCATLRLVVSHPVWRQEMWEVCAHQICAAVPADGPTPPPLHLHTEVLPDRSYDPSLYEADLVHVPVPAEEGAVRVPVIICYRKDTRREGGNPVLLDVYGSYGDCNDVDFSRNRLSLLDRGVAFAVAWVRGGGELGRQWRDAGRLDHRRNSVVDYCACAEYLIENGWAQRGRLAARGGSAGGTVVSAAAMLRPELFCCVLASVPFVDCLTTMLDADIPLTTLEWEEWGNPAASPATYDVIGAYSPMDNIPAFSRLCLPPRPQKRACTTQDVFFDAPLPPALEQQVRAMPHWYIESSFEDSRVPYWEPAAFAARLRAVSLAMSKSDQTYKAPLILHRCQLGAGHGGATGRFEYLKDVAREYAFLFKVFGMPLACAPTAYSTESSVSSASDPDEDE